MDTPKGSGRTTRMSTRMATPQLSERKRQLFRSRSSRLNEIEDDDDEVEDSVLGLSPLKPHGKDMRKVNKNLFINEEPVFEGRRLRSSSSSSPETNKENKKKTHGNVISRRIEGDTGEGEVEQLPHLFTKTMRLNSQNTSNSPRTPKKQQNRDDGNDIEMASCDSSLSSPGSSEGYTSPSPRKPIKRVQESSPKGALASSMSSRGSPSRKIFKIQPEESVTNADSLSSFTSPVSSDGSPHSTLVEKKLEQSIPTMAFYSKVKEPSQRQNIIIRSGGGGSLRKRGSKIKTSPTSSRRRLGINRGVSHNIRKSNHVQPRHLPPIQLDYILNSLRNEKLKEIINQKREERAKVEEVYQILRSAKDPIKMAKPLSVMKDDANNNTSTSNNITTTDFSDLSEDEEQGDYQVQQHNNDLAMDLEPVIPIIRHQPMTTTSPTINEPSIDLGKRKFFKSGRKSQTHMEVRITDHIRASVSHGKIELIRKPPKTARRLRVKSSTIFSAEQATVDAILKNLDETVIDDIVESSEPIRSASVPLPETLNDEGEEDFNLNLNGDLQDLKTTTTVDTFASYRQRLPYNTQDPEIIEQQEILLEFLISNNICTEANFKIFIAEPDSHKTEANNIVDELYEIINAEEPGKDNAQTVDKSVPEVVSHQYVPQPEPEPEPESHVDVNTVAPPKLFPIFTQRLQPLVKRSQRRKAPNRQRWLSSAATGSNQYQIDAGQKEFGARQCQQCGLVYTVHEPEEEQLHREYHNSVHVLRFKGWIDEDVIAACPEWSTDGRVIRLNERAPVTRLQRLHDLIKVVDKELGYSSYIVPKIFVAFFAVRKQQIVGLCLVQPLSQAHRFIQIDGTDYFSEEIFEASCGISRIWVSPLHRRQGIARKLIQTVQCHTILGQKIPVDRIAFSAPTDDGRLLARHITQNDNFLTYDQ